MSYYVFHLMLRCSPNRMETQTDHWVLLQPDLLRAKLLIYIKLDRALGYEETVTQCLESSKNIFACIPNGLINHAKRTTITRKDSRTEQKFLVSL